MKKATLAVRKVTATGRARFYNPESMNIYSFLPRLTGIVVLFLGLLPLRAQETKFYIPDVTADAGGAVAIDVFANGMSSVVGVQFSLSWDTLIFAYEGVSNIALNGTPAGNFNQTQVDSGRVGYLEVDENLVGLNLPDSSRLFTLNLRSLEPFAVVTELSFNDAPLRFSAMDNMNNRLDCVKDIGTITLEGTSGVRALAEDPRFSVAPNPFTEFVRVNSKLNYGGKATLEILDLRGRLISQRQIILASGAQSTPLSAAEFGKPGAYIIRLVTDREQLHRKVVLQSSFR